jgi:hypothetical protein
VLVGRVHINTDNEAAATAVNVEANMAAAFASCATGAGGGSCGIGMFADEDTCSFCAQVANCASGLTCTSATDSVCATCSDGYSGNGTSSCVKDLCATVTCGANATCSAGTCA